jgi:hypothetical protein
MVDELQLPAYIEKAQDAYIKGVELFQDMAGWTEIKQSCSNVTAYQRESA